VPINEEEGKEEKEKEDEYELSKGDAVSESDVQ
jgi:hypothetical protein